MYDFNYTFNCKDFLTRAESWSDHQDHFKSVLKCLRQICNWVWLMDGIFKADIIIGKLPKSLKWLLLINEISDMKANLAKWQIIPVNNLIIISLSIPSARPFFTKIIILYCLNWTKQSSLYNLRLWFPTHQCPQFWDWRWPEYLGPAALIFCHHKLASWMASHSSPTDTWNEIHLNFVRSIFCLLFLC